MNLRICLQKKNFKINSGMLDKKKFYINGKWIAPIEPRNYKVIDPSNEEPCAEISLGGKEDVNKAVSAAKKAFESWAFT